MDEHQSFSYIGHKGITAGGHVGAVAYNAHVVLMNGQLFYELV